MLNNPDVQPGLIVRPSLSWLQIWRTAVTRPTVAAYQDLIHDANISPYVAYLWLFASSLIGGLLISAAALFRRSEPASGASLLLAILIFALMHTVMCVVFAGCVHGVVRLLRGRGAYQELVKLIAAFNTPLVVLASLLALVPRSSFVLLSVYLYGLLLYSLAVRAMYHLSRAKAIGSVLIALLLLGSALLGTGLLIVSW